MQKSECRMQNEGGKHASPLLSVFVLLSSFIILHFLLSSEPLTHPTEKAAGIDLRGDALFEAHGQLADALGGGAARVGDQERRAAADGERDLLGPQQLAGIH